MSDDTYLFGREIDGKVYVPFEDVRPMLNRRDDEIERLREALHYYSCDCKDGDCMEAFRGELCGMKARAALWEGK